MFQTTSFLVPPLRPTNEGAVGCLASQIHKGRRIALPQPFPAEWERELF
ncbi:hypothetical protein HMPREF3156_01269 [Neisseria sp. HMSC06F02]|nr:hypothetical protein HMPREF3156_01269 [Neisseria sp. HMSC06F02]